ncbi:Smr/MutS family protein [Erythrobacter sp. Alg231-14]|uniref:Smr/MutS family protein n=1 Tax=Erythrobacter sp. Alg231-14 TaxID=1922225 RepID=UPI000D556B54
MTFPRGLSVEEAEAWSRLAESVTPMPGRMTGDRAVPKTALQPMPGVAGQKPLKQMRAPKTIAKPPPKSPPKIQPQQKPAVSARRVFNSQLDGHWNRKLKSGQIAPDYTLDLHGHTLDSAYDRITSGLDQARAMGARVVLVIAGRERPSDPADRGSKRGAIRAKLLDWLAASHHADAIAAVRRAHIRHGGEGALYLVLRRAG